MWIMTKDDWVILANVILIIVVMLGAGWVGTLLYNIK
jgi:hypothetical protein